MGGGVQASGSRRLPQVAAGFAGLQAAPLPGLGGAQHILVLKCAGYNVEAVEKKPKGFFSTLRLAAPQGAAKRLLRKNSSSTKGQ